MKKKILSAFVILVMLLGVVSCQKTSDQYDSEKNNNSQQLQILKSDLKLTQEQVMSQIKAEHIKKNNGYLDSDEIIAIITLSEDALIDIYNNEYASKIESVSEFVDSAKGKRYNQKIISQQNSLIEELEQNGLIISVEHTYSTIINAIAVKTTYGNFKKISNLNLVESTILSDTYNLPQTTTDISAIENIVDVYETGIFNSSSVSYTGEGTAVAVLDSGFDCSHSVFATQPSKEMITAQDVSAKLSLTKAASMTANLELSDVYYSRKIPFVYDYADKDSDVFPYDSGHGTHVAGIIGGQDDVITGVAINTQLVLLKVFPDLSDGAETDGILAALEDAVLLGVDAINMSLGSSCGFTREEDGNAINAVYDKINDSGISLITAASNSYSSGFGGEQGNTNFVTNPDSGTVGSPSTYAASLSVASISGTKSKYIIGNDSQVLFFKESNSITGDENDFLAELGIGKGESKTFEYVTIPGVGLKVNYSTVGDLTGKIALIKRGDNTFEEKAQNAKNAGAIACIIYNNIDGDITMSMGKSDHIPTISISKDDGTILAQKSSGTLTISDNYQAGPFMSDFSSWGPTPSLELKPEITAHGGNITSAVPGGGYDQQSGTSMAAPNLCGIVVLIRQYLKEKYPTYTAKEISVMTNQLLMSTATIVKNQEGNPYSPRKQGAGLASLYNAVNTKAYLTVDGIDRTKLELFDDPTRSGVYTMEFNIVNLSDTIIKYDLSLIGMTESVSTSDNEHVSEMSQLLSDNAEFEVISGGKLSDKTISVDANQTAKVKVTYRLSKADKELIDSLFPYGMYVEGFVKLTAKESGEIDLNIPFLAFYGDWTEAPMFDKTYYEVESEAHDASIDDEDKLKADYYATTPYGSYYYNYIIPLGTYLYDIDTTKYDPIPASEEHIAISNFLGAIDGISAVYGGLLRNAKTMTFTITDKLTGEVIYEHIDYNATKAYSYGSSPVPYFEYLKLKSYSLGLVNNRQYEFMMKGELDYGDGGVNTNVRNSFSFDFYLDDEAPVLKEVSYEKVYDKTLKKDRYYMTMIVYDNQYVQSITPIIFTSTSSYTFLTENPIPVYSEQGQDNKIRFEITDFLDDIFADKVITSALAFSIDDYALNSNIYLCQLPGTQGDFKFTKDGTMDGSDMMILSMYEDEVIDLTKYLATADSTVDENKDYLKHLIWTSSNEKVAVVNEGQVRGLDAGRATITVQEGMNLKQAVLIINVKERPKEESLSLSLTSNDVEDVNDETIKSIRFSYFDTLFAYSRAAQTSEIGSTGDRKFISSLSTINFYPGEKIQLFYDLDPWYVEDKYELTYKSTNPNVATVDENGVVTALKKGSTTITLSVGGSNLMATVRITVKSEFVIENRTLIAYKGLGGEVVIPDDEGILYIGSYAFCLYETDQSIELPEDDYDANKIPSMNTSVTSVIIPDGVEEIQKYAFYNCTSLRSVVIPNSVKYIREWAFYNDQKLDNINLTSVQTIGREAFKNCTNLKSIEMKEIYAIGVSAFEGCSALEKVDLTTLRNTGARAFKDCTNLKNVTLTENTKLSYAMFVNSGITSIDIYEKVEIPAWCFAKCQNLQNVNIHNDLVSIGVGAFSECSNLTDFNMEKTVLKISEQAFYASSKLEKITLPNNEVTLGNYCFYQCTSLTEVVFQENTKIEKIEGSIFEDTNLTTFNVNKNNPYYAADEYLLTSKDGKTIVFAATSVNYGDYIIDESYEAIGEGAFSGINITTLTILNENLKIGTYAFANCAELTTIIFPGTKGVVIGNHAFNYAENLTEVINLDKITTVGDYAFANTALNNVIIGSNATYGEGAFFKSKVETVTIGENTNFGLGAFQNCSYLKTVNMPENGGVHFGVACFGYDLLLEKIDLSKIDGIIEEETFYGCSSLKSANLENVTEVGDYAFADCSTLNYVNMPNVISIGEGAFARYDTEGGAPQFSEIILPNTLTTLGDGAFLGCEGLVEITLPESLVNVGNYLFSYCVNLQKVVLPKNLKQIGEFNFAGCELLTNINLENIEEIGKYAFTSSVSLQNVTLTKVKTIGEGAFAQTSLNGSHILNELVKAEDYAFQGTNLSSIDAPNLKYIGLAAFQNNTNLSEFTFSQQIEKVDTLAFNGCTSLTSFYYLHDEEKTSSGKINDYALLENGVLYTTLPSNKLQLTSVPGGMKEDTLEVLEGTNRIDQYAGNENTNITKIVLPDSLKIIGNYAFYGYKNLKTVEFKSFIAPTLEDEYNDTSELLESDPGYDLLHKHFDLFGLELYYYTFIDLVGKKEPIEMILPANEDLVGYDSIVYEVYFGKVSDAKRSEYVAMHKNMIDFITYADKISQIDKITLSNETLINNAITALNAIKQDPTNYGYTVEEWNQKTTVVLDAKKTLAALKLANASQKVQDLQVQINNLPTTFDISKLSMLKELSISINALKFEDRALLDLTNYNTLVNSYNDYLLILESEVEPVIKTVDNTFVYVGTIATTVLGLGVALFIMIKKRWFI